MPNLFKLRTVIVQYTPLVHLLVCVKFCSRILSHRYRTHDFGLQAVIRTDVSGLLEKLKDDRYAWMRIRITETWPQWKEATEQLAATLNVKNRTKKKVNLGFSLNIAECIDQSKILRTVHTYPSLKRTFCPK